MFKKHVIGYNIPFRDKESKTRVNWCQFCTIQPKEKPLHCKRSILFVFLSTDVFLMELSCIETGIQWWRELYVNLSYKRSQMAQTKTIKEVASPVVENTGKMKAWV